MSEAQKNNSVITAILHILSLFKYTDVTDSVCTVKYTTT